MTVSNTLVSVIVPVYNGERFLMEAIQDIEAQGHAPLETLVIDDGSTDGTAALLAELGDQVRPIHQSNRGPAAARNRGIESARGDVIAFHDVDDLWAPGTLAALLAHLDAHPEIDIAQGLIQRLVLERAAEPGEAPVFQPCGEPYQFINLGSALYRRRVFDRVGLLDEALRENEDTDWFFRAWEQNVTKAVLPRPALLYRLHDGNSVHSQNLVGGGLPRMFQRHLARLRRGTAGTAKDRPNMRAYIGEFPPPPPRPACEAEP